MQNLRSGPRGWLYAAAALGASLSAAACIPVRLQAPDEPIEINLNVNIRQEVIVRLEGEARDLLQDNPDLF